MNSVSAEVQGWVLSSPEPTIVADRSVPSGVDASDLATYCTMLGDDALLLSHRLSEWATRAPELEENMALGAITLELLGQARGLLARAAEIEGTGWDEDRLAYFRDARQFRNVRLAEIDCGPGPGGDFAATVARSLVFATWRHAVFERLVSTRDPVLSVLAANSLPSVTRHRDHAAQWVIRLGDGSAGSKQRMLAGLRRVWPLVGELFHPHAVEIRLAKANCAVNPAIVREDVATDIDETLSVARLRLPDLAAQAPFAGSGGRDGAHTESMDFVVAELQHIARSDSPLQW
ncbi:1,2-phenylacetyl-CoA epoxidase subunit PaaC [Parasphingorhabdus pacifica]